MKENYLIEISSSLKSSNDEDTVNLKTIGDFVQKGDKKYIVYKEYTGKTPDDFTVNTLKITDNNCVELIKNNVKQTRMIFEKNRRNHCLYHTDVGTLAFGVFTSDIDFGGDEFGGSLKLKYTLDVNSSLISANELNVEFRKIGE